jgi:hypothetical protein
MPKFHHTFEYPTFGGKDFVTLIQQKYVFPSILSTLGWKCFCYFGREAPLPNNKTMAALFPFISLLCLAFQFPPTKRNAVVVLHAFVF